MNPPQFAICAILVTLISLFHPSTSQTPPPSSSSNLIQDICKQVSENSDPPIKVQDCLTTFASDPSAPTADLMGLAKITLDHGKKNATEGLKHIQSLLEGGGTSSLSMPQKEALGSCLGLFLNSVNSFWKAWFELDYNIPAADADVGLAWDNASSCRSNLLNAHVWEYSIEARLDSMQLYSTIGVLITGILDGKN
ncbi:Cell wall / vacuolar inhibitor of fructosidase 2 [Linum grandiflorum]